MVIRSAYAKRISLSRLLVYRRDICMPQLPPNFHYPPIKKLGSRPVGRFEAADEVAEVAVMLARNSYVTRQTINVNGWYMS